MPAEQGDCGGTERTYQFSLDEVARPIISVEEAAALVEKHWGLDVLSVTELGSYEDRNFLVEAAPGDGKSSVRRVLKVTNTEFSSIPRFLEAQNALFSHLGFHGLRSPVAEPTVVDSRLMVLEDLPGGPSKARLLKFVPGSTLKSAKKTPALLRSVGRYLARVDAALADFWHPGIRETHDWAVDHVADAVRQFGHLLQDGSRRAVARSVADLFEQLALPAADQLRTQLIHGDANENNIIVDEAAQEVVALIDWSDVMTTWCVAEVAISAAYILLMTMTDTHADNESEDKALQAVAHMLAGFHQQQPLSDLDWELLPVLMAGRLMQSTLIGLYTVSKDPGNASYVLPDEQDRWRCLNLLLGCPPREMARRLRNAADASIQNAVGADSAGGVLGRQQGVSGAPPMLPARLPPFKLELYLARYEHLPLQLSRSSCQPLPLKDLLAMSDDRLAQQWHDLELGYPPNIGSLQLRQEVSSHYPGTGPDHVLSCVPNEGIFLTMAALLAPGDVVVAMHPAYQSLLEVARSVGARVKTWSMEIEAETGRPYFSLDALRSLMASEVKCLVVNLPHNPSGWLPSRQEWAEIVDMARDANAWLFSDEIYRLLEQNPEEQRLEPAACAYPGRGISLGGLSKAFGLQGLRAGWLVCRDAGLLEQAERVKSYITTTGPIISEVLAVVALKNERQLVGRCVDIIRGNLEVAAGFFSRWPVVFQWTPPSAGSLCLPRLITGDPIDAFCTRATEGCGVVLLPATVYDHDAASAGQHFRLGLGRSNFKEALQALDRWLEGEQRRLHRPPAP